MKRYIKRVLWRTSRHKNSETKNKPSAFTKEKELLKTVGVPFSVAASIQEPLLSVSVGFSVVSAEACSKVAPLIIRTCLGLGAGGQERASLCIPMYSHRYTHEARNRFASDDINCEAQTVLYCGNRQR